MINGDWMQMDKFKNAIMEKRQNGIVFISLEDAYSHICNDWFRNKQYAVLTFDDGYASLKEILPWLEAESIPFTLFINGKYLDGKSYRNNQKEQYLTKTEIFGLVSPKIEIGSHGWEHSSDVKKKTESEFAEYIDKNIQLLSNHPRYISFHAYTWGHHTKATDKQLAQMNIIPVLMDGAKNYNDTRYIHRELLS